MNTIKAPYKRNWKDFFCPIMLTVDIITGKWKLLTLWQLLNNWWVRRYGELKKWLIGISEKMLIQTLRELESDWLVIRTIYPGISLKVEYSLTSDWRDFENILKSLWEFWEKWKN